MLGVSELSQSWPAFRLLYASDQCPADHAPHACGLGCRVGCSCADLKEAGYSEGLKLAGFTAKECKDGGYNAKALKKAGFSASDCKAVGFAAAIKAAGFSIEEARAAGFTCEGARRRARLDGAE